MIYKIFARKNKKTIIETYYDEMTAYMREWELRIKGFIVCSQKEKI